MVKSIETEADYQQALKRIDQLMEAKPDTPEGDELDVLATLVERYESLYFPIDLPDPVEAIKFRMEQSGLTKKDLAPHIGSKPRY
jgi:HTH-type transcriptional regulator/antitoxin HigA